MMRKNNEPIVPKLRFPEFHDEAGWQEKPIHEFLIEECRPIDMVDNKEYSLVTVKRRYGGIVSRGIFQGKSIKVKSQFLIQENDFLISNRQIVHKACGVVPKKLEGSIVSNEYSVLKAKENCDVVFFDYFAQQPKVSESFLKSSVGIVIEKMRFNLSDWLKREFVFPKLQEQQKIADCLTSIDELITLHTQKLDALKDYKKGLMQQLFPAEGEKVPRLRFPEFRDAGEWDVSQLNEVCVRIMDGTHFSPKSLAGPFKYLTSKNIRNGRIDLSNISMISEEEHKEIFKRCPVEKYDLLLTKDGANTGNCALNLLGEQFSLLSSVAVLRGNPEILLQSFLYQSFLSCTIQLQIKNSMSGQAITRITLRKIGSYQFFYPSLEEQQKIADCLTSMDEQINAQSEKIESLKTHKKGLLQQLFPSLEEALK